VSAVDHRREPRVQARTLVNAVTLSQSGFETDLSLGRTLDLSRDGMRLELDHALPPGSTLRLSVALEDHVLTIHGVVRYLRDVDARAWEMGIEFLDVLSVVDYEVLNHYLLDRRSLD